MQHPHGRSLETEEAPDVAQPLASVGGAHRRNRRSQAHEVLRSSVAFLNVKARARTIYHTQSPSSSTTDPEPSGSSSSSFISPFVQGNAQPTLAPPDSHLPQIDRRSRRLGTNRSFMDIFLDSPRHETATPDSDPEIDDSYSIMARANSCHGPFHLHHIPQWRSHPAPTPITWEDPRDTTAQIVTEKEGKCATDRPEFEVGVWRRGGRPSLDSGHDWDGRSVAIIDVKTLRLESAERSTVDWKSELELGHGTAAGDPGVSQML